MLSLYSRLEINFTGEQDAEIKRNSWSIARYPRHRRHRRMGTGTINDVMNQVIHQSPVRVISVFEWTLE